MATVDRLGQSVWGPELPPRQHLRRLAWWHCTLPHYCFADVLWARIGWARLASPNEPSLLKLGVRFVSFESKWCSSPALTPSNPLWLRPTKEQLNKPVAALRYSARLTQSRWYCTTVNHQCTFKWEPATTAHSRSSFLSLRKPVLTRPKSQLPKAWANKVLIWCELTFVGEFECGRLAIETSYTARSAF